MVSLHKRRTLLRSLTSVFLACSSFVPPIPVAAQSLDVERRGTIAEVRLDRGGLLGAGRAELVLQVDYLYRATSLMGEAVINCGLRARDIRGSVSFEHRGQRVTVTIDSTNEHLISVPQATFVMDFQLPGQQSRLGLRCGEGVIARSDTEPFNVAGSPPWERAFCRYPDPANARLPESFGFDGWCTGLRGNFIDRDEARTLYREAGAHESAVPVIRSMSIGIGNLIAAWGRGELTAAEVTGGETEVARRTRAFAAALQTEYAIRQARALAAQALGAGSDLDEAHARALAQCESTPRPQRPLALSAASPSAQAVDAAVQDSSSTSAIRAGDAEDAAASSVVSLVLLIDVSGSMDGRKIEAARRAAIETVRRAAQTSNTEFAVFSFTGECSSPDIDFVGFGRDAIAAERFINGLEARGGTPLGPAIARVNRYIAQSRASSSGEQMVILLADGDDGCDSVGQELEVLRRAGTLFRHDTIGLEVSGSAATTLRQVATESGGTYRDAATPQAVAGAFEAVVSEMDRRNRARAAELERLRAAHERELADWQTTRDQCIAVANTDLEHARAEMAARERREQEVSEGLRGLLDRRRGVDAGATTGRRP